LIDRLNYSNICVGSEIDIVVVYRWEVS